MREKMKKPEVALRVFFLVFTVLCFITALIVPDRANMLTGLKQICTCSGQISTSFFDASRGGIAGSFLNAGLVCLVMVLLYSLPGAKPDGLACLAFFLTAGFSFWGITILNIWFSFAGVAIYALVTKKSFGSMSNAFIFSTGLAPLITELMFHYPYLGEETAWQFSFAGLLIALAVGIFIGFMLPAGMGHSPKMHQGYDLYSAAVPIGLAAFFLRALLYRNFVPAPPAAQAVGLKDSFTAASYGFLCTVFVLAVVYGLLCGGGKKYMALLKDTGFNTDYTSKYGIETTIMNFGIYGLFIMLYYTVIGATWTGLTFGCVLCMVCCFAKGSHPRNVWPIMAGYVISSFIGMGVCKLTGADFNLAINAQAIVVGVCFANGLSPVAGHYGWPIGILFGGLHYFLVTSVPLLHGAFCLYNGGFTAGLTCMLFMPVIQQFFKNKDEKAQA